MRPCACRATPWLAPALSLLLLLPGCSGSSTSGPGASGPGPSPSLPGAPVQMTLPRLGGGSLSLESLRGRPVLITLFTTWWVPCQEEAPAFQRLDERFRSRGLAVVGIALNTGGSTPAKLVALYVEEVGFRFPVLLASPDDLELVGGLGPTKAVPRTILLDRQGRIVLDQTGATRFQELERKILEMLRTDREASQTQTDDAVAVADADVDDQPRSSTVSIETMR